MADITETLRDILGDNADEKISGVLSMLGGGASQLPSGAQSSDNENAAQLFSQAQGLMKQLSHLGGDDRSRLLMSLKPFLRESRQHSVDNAVKLLNLAQFSHMFKGVF